MLNIDFELANQNNLSAEDLVFISYIELKLQEKKSDKGVITYKEILNELPIVFNSKSEQVNLKKLRRMLDNENMNKFITREVKQLGRGVGATTIFHINKENIDKLKIKGLVN